MAGFYDLLSVLGVTFPAVVSEEEAAGEGGGNYFIVEVWDKTETTRLTKWKRYSSLWYEDKIDGNSQGQIKFPITLPEVTAANIKHYNRVRIYQGTTLKWRGIITQWSIRNKEVTVDFDGHLYILQKRTVSQTYSDQIDTIAEDIITNMNGTDDTGITFGGCDSSATREFDFVRTRILDALRKGAATIGADVWVDLSKQLFLSIPRGSDKSATITFKLIDSRPNETNIEQIDVVNDGGKVANRIIGLGSSSLTSDQSDGASQTEFGLLEDVVSFSSIDGQTSLDEATDREVDERDAPLIIPKIRPITSKIAETLYDVGDTVGVHIERGFFVLDDSYRVVSKKVNVRQDAQTADVDVGLSDKAQSRTDLLQEIAEIQRRVYALEQS